MMKIYDAYNTAANICTLIDMSGMSVREIADRMGVIPQAVYRWKKGITSPTVDNLVVLSGLLNVSLDDLIATKELSEGGENK